MRSIALRGLSAIGGPLISNPSMWQLLSASAGHCNTRSHVTLENYTYMTLQHLLTCDTQTLASHVTVEHYTFMTLKHLHDTQTLEHTSRHLMYSISTCVTFKQFHYKTWKHYIVAILTYVNAILQHSMWYQYQVFKFTSWLLRCRGSSSPPQKTLPQCIG